MAKRLSLVNLALGTSLLFLGASYINKVNTNKVKINRVFEDLNISLFNLDDTIKKIFYNRPYFKSEDIKNVYLYETKNGYSIYATFYDKKPFNNYGPEDQLELVIGKGNHLLKKITDYGLNGLFSNKDKYYICNCENNKNNGCKKYVIPNLNSKELNKINNDYFNSLKFLLDNDK